MKNPEPSTQQRQEQIRQLIDRWAQAFEKRDVNGVMSIYLPGNDLIAFDIIPPLAYRGSGSYRRDYEDFFKQYKGPLHVEFGDVHIVAGNSVAFSYGLEKISGTLVDGTPSEVWVRFTEGYRYQNDRWYAVHDHISVPAELTTGKARLDLKP
jgi:ketosteroid isomerase-like protein